MFLNQMIISVKCYYKEWQHILLQSATEQAESFWNLESVSIQPAEVRGEGTDFLHRNF